MKRVFVSLMLLMAMHGFGQSNKPGGPVIQTPNTASMAIYGEVPVSYFTGLPNIDIPVYTIEERGLNFPISLSYHAQGFKPESHPSWVGANWSLNFGGMITRKMNKLPDEWKNDDYGINGYYYCHDRLNNYNWSSNDTLLTMGGSNVNTNLALDRLDREPDEFSFNFLGHSGKFYLDHLGKWRVQSNKNLRVICNESDIVTPFFHSSMPNSSALVYFYPKVFGKFTLIDDQGIQYIFGSSGGNDGIEYSSSITPPGFNYRVWMIATSWSLLEIKLPDNTGSITINYERGPFQSSFQYYESQNRFFVNRCDMPSAVNAKGLSGSITWPVYAKSIQTTSGVTVDLKFSKSNELAYPTSTYFEVFRDEFGRLPSQQSPPENIPLEYFNFMQSSTTVPYYVANGIYADGIISSNKFVWFKLDSVEVSNWDLNNNMAKTAFKRVVFNYRENASERLKLLSVKVKGAAPDNESQDYMMKYNDWGAAAPVYASDLTDHWGFANNKPLKREATYGGFDWFGGNMLTNRSPNETATKIDILTEITYPTGGRSSFEYEPNDYGKYLLPNTRSYAPGGAGIAGGLRVKKIINTDGKGDIDSREFFYVNGYVPSVPLSTLTSSGILDGKPANNHYNYSLTTPTGLYLSIYASNGVVPLSSNSGAICGYSEVAEKFADGSYKIYKFTNHDNGYIDYDPINNITPAELGIPYRSRSFERGQPLSEELYGSGGNLVQKTDYTYVRIGAGADSNFVRSLRKEFGGYCTNVTLLIPYGGAVAMGYQVPMLNGFFVDPASYTPTYTTATAYGYYAYKFMPEKITSKVYGTTAASGQFIVNEKTILYDGNGNAVQTSENDSKGNVIVSNLKYPYHFAGTAIYDAMIARNMGGMPVETETYRGAKLLGKDKTNFDFFNSGALIKPKTITRQIGSNAPFTVIQFNRYDEFGNVLEFQQPDGIKNSFVWSYFKSRPIAKISGVDYSAIEPLLNQSILSYPTGGHTQLLAHVDNLRTQFPAAYVSTFLYDSKSDWEMKQSKDPNGINIYYEYDLMGRLSVVKDNYNKLLSLSEYKYNDVALFPYRNTERSQIFAMTNCPAGYAGSALYTVAADKYGSFISQADADQKAQNEINANGQAYANANGVCNPYWSYTACCGFGCVYSNFVLTGTGSVNFSLIITKSPPGGGSGLTIGNLSGALFLPSANRNISYNSGGVSGMITIMPSGEVKLSGSVGTKPVQITGTYAL